MCKCIPNVHSETKRKIQEQNSVQVVHGYIIVHQSIGNKTHTKQVCHVLEGLLLVHLKYFCETLFISDVTLPQHSFINSPFPPDRFFHLSLIFLTNLKVGVRKDGMAAWTQVVCAKWFINVEMNKHACFLHRLSTCTTKVLNRTCIKL